VVDCNLSGSTCQWKLTLTDNEWDVKRYLRQGIINFILESPTLLSKQWPVTFIFNKKIHKFLMNLKKKNKKKTFYLS